MDDYPKTAEELVKSHDQYIKDWIAGSNTAKIDAQEFISSFYHKVLTKNTLEKFDPDYGVKFETWLSKVLQNHYYNQVNQSLKDNWISIQTFSDEEKDDMKMYIFLQNFPLLLHLDIFYYKLCLMTG